MPYKYPKKKTEKKRQKKEKENALFINGIRNPKEIMDW